MNYTKNILNEIPVQKKNIILDKMKKFEEILLSNISLNGIPKGFWIRRINGTDIYKFRVSNGDRILFKYINDNGKRDIIFISYCNHDQQIRKGKNINLKDQDYIIDDNSLDLDINKYEEDNFDREINNYAKYEIYENLQKIKDELVIEDEYIAVAIEDNNDESLKFLSIQQYECIADNENPLLILGCAGSGKTNIAIRKLILNNKLKVKSAYITCNDAIKNKTKSIYSSLEINSDYILFKTLREICFDIIGCNDYYIVSYYDFYNWFINSNLAKMYEADFKIIEIWIEINSLIKGKLSSEKIMSLDKYLNYFSDIYDLKLKKKIYKIAIAYQSWLNLNNYIDDNDLVFEAMNKLNKYSKFDYIIYDEVQELTEKQLALLIKINNYQNNLMLLGDANQTLSSKNLDFKFLKEQLYNEGYKVSQKNINKNYRNSFELVQWINELKKIKNIKFKSNSKEFAESEIAIKNGTKPIIIYNMKKNKEFLRRVNNVTNSIVIVADEEDKLMLKERGYGVDRIFTVEEVKGLEYDNIYCYNIISKFENIWEEVLENIEKNKKINKIYFNILYIAATRCKKSLFFIENKKTKINDILDKYCSLIDNENIILDTLVGGVSKEEWLKEAKKLEEQKKYYQAYKAYEKAEEKEKAEICMRAYNRKTKYENTKKFASYILIHCNKIDKEIIENVLMEIYYKYEVTIKGVIKICRYDAKCANELWGATKYIDKDSEIEEIAEIISSEITSEEFNKSKLYIKCCFYLDEEPIQMKLLSSNKHEDLFIRCCDENIIIDEFNCDHIRSLEEQALKEIEAHEKILGKEVNDDLMIEKRRKKYENETAESILKYVFG